MDGFAQNEVSQGNSMLGQMREYNREVLRHNDSNRQTFNTQIQTAKQNEKATKTSDAATGTISQLGETGAQITKVGKDVSTAYGIASKASDFGQLSRAGQVGRVAGRTLADSGAGQAIAKIGTQAEDTVITGSRVAKQAGDALQTVGRTGRDAIQTARTALGSSEGASQVLARGATGASATGALSRAGASGVSSITNAAEGASSAVAKTAPVIGDVGANIGRVGKAIEGASKLGAFAGIAKGGYDALEDAIGGHIMGKNANSRAGNELGIASGIADAVGLFIPGAGIIGAGLGIASAVEGYMGDKKQSATQIETTLPGQEKSGMETTVTGGGATAASTGANTQTQRTPTSSITSGGGAF